MGVCVAYGPAFVDAERDLVPGVGMPEPLPEVGIAERRGRPGVAIVEVSGDGHGERWTRLLTCTTRPRRRPATDRQSPKSFTVRPHRLKISSSSSPATATLRFTTPDTNVTHTLYVPWPSGICITRIDSLKDAVRRKLKVRST